jgi:hypothetical protein
MPNGFVCGLEELLILTDGRRVSSLPAPAHRAQEGGKRHENSQSSQGQSGGQPEEDSQERNELRQGPEPSQDPGVQTYLDFSNRSGQRRNASCGRSVGGSRTVRPLQGYWPPMIALSWTAQLVNRQEAVQDLDP